MIGAPDKSYPSSWAIYRWLPGDDVAVARLSDTSPFVADIAEFLNVLHHLDTTGDPACDLLIAWSVLGASSRRALRDRLDVDDAMWSRGRGWALSVGAIALPYYRHTHPRLVATARRMIDAVLSFEDDGL
jgi:aminoglycoside phosphotransferase (APT) family kinase protein